MEKKLKKIFLNHSGKLSDKWSLYINEWDQIFSSYRDQEINLFEIGIQNGGSLEIWSKYFNKAKHMIGCDVDEDCRSLQYEDPRISIIIGDANTDDLEKSLLQIVDGFDIIIDDGSHQSSDVIKSFSRYFKFLREGGLYLAEDLHTSFWDSFGGGVHDPYSSMAFFKRLSDIINYEHWRTPKTRENHLCKFMEKFDINFNEFDLNRIHSINFVNSLCVIQKRSPEENSLGRRIIVGNEEPVTENWKKLNQSTIFDIPVQIKDDSKFDVFTLMDENKKILDELTKQTEKNQELANLTKAQEKSIKELSTGFQQKQQMISDLNAELQQKEQEVLYYALSKSWRITRPLRKIKNLLKGN